MTHSRELAAGGLRRRAPMDASSRSTPPTRCARPRSVSGLPGDAPELMERAGTRGRRRGARALPDGAASRSSAAAARTAATGGSRRATSRRRAATCASSTEASDADLGEPDVVVDALFGTGFRGEPRPDAARADRGDERARRRRSSRSTCPRGSTRRPARSPARPSQAALTVTFHGREGRRTSSRRAASTPATSSSPTSGSSRADRGTGSSTPRDPRGSCRARGATRQQVHRRLGARRRRLARPDRAPSASPRAAAFRADAGYVAVAAPASALPVVEARLLEAVKRPCPENGTASSLRTPSTRSSSCRAGARGRDRARARARPRTPALVRRLLGALAVPVVVDADGLFGLEPDGPRRRRPC